MKNKYSVQVMDKSKWRQVEIHKCNKEELRELKINLQDRMANDKSGLNTFRIVKIK